MKYIKYMIVPLLVLALVLSACGKDEKKEKQNKEDKELKKELVNNEWKEKEHFNDKDEDNVFFYVFRKDGSYMLDGSATIDEGRYTVKNKKLKLKSEDYEDRTIKLKKPLKEFKSHDEPGTTVYKKAEE